VTCSDHKAALRARLRAARRAAAQARPDAAEEAARLAPVERFPAFACVGAYRPMGSEMDPAPLPRRLAATGVMLALPRAVDRDAPLEYRLWDGGSPLSPDAFGVASPPASAPLAHPDLVIAPLLGFDRGGHRLGQGGGTYDRTLANLRASRRVFVLGLAYSAQETDQIPHEPHDQRLDAVLTEAAYLEFGD
jgi:5-formyltetrahydrofolate cyclo-ligase